MLVLSKQKHFSEHQHSVTPARQPSPQMSLISALIMSFDSFNFAWNFLLYCVTVYCFSVISKWWANVTHSTRFLCLASLQTKALSHFVLSQDTLTSIFLGWNTGLKWAVKQCHLMTHIGIAFFWVSMPDFTHSVWKQSAWLRIKMNTVPERKWTAFSSWETNNRCIKMGSVITSTVLVWIKTPRC